MVDFLPSLGAILVAVIAAFGAWAAQRSAAKANYSNTKMTGRLDAEKEAYERARGFDLKTIEYQELQIVKLREDNTLLHEELDKLKRRIADLEHKFPELRREINEHFKHDDQK